MASRSRTPNTQRRTSNAELRPAPPNSLPCGGRAPEERSNVVAAILEESKHFIEWTTIEAELEVQVRLVHMQRHLAR
jgi:hypothetical protein